MSELMKTLFRNADIPVYAMADEGAGAAGGSADGAGGAGADAGSGGAGGDAGAAADAGAGAGGSADAGADGGDGNADAGNAAEYVDDPAKTPEENAAAKADFEAEKERQQFYGAPDKYADITVPEGMAFDQDTADSLHGLAKKMNLSQDAVNSLIDLQKGLAEKNAAAGAKEWEDTKAEWDATVKADAELGGSAYDENMGYVAKARAAFGTPELDNWLDTTELGQHPEVKRLLLRVGKAMGEGKSITGGKQQSSETAADILYDHPSSKR